MNADFPIPGPESAIKYGEMATRRKERSNRTEEVKEELPVKEMIAILGRTDK